MTKALIITFTLLLRYWGFKKQDKIMYLTPLMAQFKF